MKIQSAACVEMRTLPASGPLAARIATVAALLTLCVSFSACDPSPVADPSADPTEILEAALYYDNDPGFCDDTDPDGVPYTPPRPLWSALEGPHYDGIQHVHGDGTTPSMRYPNYRNISHNLAILQTLQFLLSAISNVTKQLDQAQAFLEEGEYVDAVYGAIPQVDGHCLCLGKSYSGGSCSVAGADQLWDEVQTTVLELVDVHGLADLLEEFLNEKIVATIDDFESLRDSLTAQISPSGGLATVLEQALYQAIAGEIEEARNNMLPAVEQACDPQGFANYAGDVTAVVQAAVNELRDSLLDDAEELLDVIECAVSTTGAVLTQLSDDLRTALSYFEGVSSVGDLVRLDWQSLIATIESAIPFYEDVADEAIEAITAVGGVWDNASNFVARVEALAEEQQILVTAELTSASIQMEACIDAIMDSASYATSYDPSEFAANLTAALEAIITNSWDEARSRVQLTHGELTQRLSGFGMEAALSFYESRLAAVRLAISDGIANCYVRATRPECYDFCEAAPPDAQDSFLWLPVDFLRDPAATGAAVMSGALFALEQTGWLDTVVAWVQDQMEDDLGQAFDAVMNFFGSFGEAVQRVLDFLEEFFGYVDRFTEGYHLGAYSELRPDLHVCIGYAGHGAYAQMGSLGGDNFSIGARYTSHNLSRAQRIQFRSGGFAVSAFGYDLSLAPTVELNMQLDGFKLWDQRRPFGIPLDIDINPDTVARYDVFNVVPVDDYPFGYDAAVPFGAAIVRDLFPSRPSASAPPDWPRPGVPEPFEKRSTAVTSLGLNLQFDYGPMSLDLLEIHIIPSILVAIPYLELGFGVEWAHQTDLMRDRVVEMINKNLPVAEQLTEEDFLREMHAFQAPDLTADSGTSVYVEPGLGIEAFLGFRVWKVKIGAGARLGLAVNIRPGGHGGLLDLNAALAESLINSNPPADAPCEPEWDIQDSFQCTNKAFPESTGSYACDPLDARGSCCITVEMFEPNRAFALCVDAWTGMSAELCRLFDIEGDIQTVLDVLDSMPSVLDSLVNRIRRLIERAHLAAVNSSWTDDSCATRECGGPEQEIVFSTAAVAMTGLSECQRHGYCTYKDGAVVHDLSFEACELPSGFKSLSTGHGYGCALDPQSEVTCFPIDTAPAARFTKVSAGVDYACGLGANGVIDCWDADGAAWDSPLETGFVDFDAGPNFACALDSDGSVYCWGAVPDAVAETPGEQFKSISVGVKTVCGLSADDGSVYCWGAVSNSRPLDELQFTQILTLGDTACGLDADGEVLCRTFLTPEDPLCPESAHLAPPAGPFAHITAFGPCAVCGLRAEATVDCWGALPGEVPHPGQRFLAVDGHVEGAHLCGLNPEDNSIRCYNELDPPRLREAGSFSAYTCRTFTDATVAGWVGSGCHPLQHGFASACGCVDDDDCAMGESCDEDTGRCVDEDGLALSCACPSNGDCPPGRDCVAGACVKPCVTDNDCAMGRECRDSYCLPPHGVPYAETITSGMADVEAPMHLVSTYAMADILTTLILKVNLYVEASFKLFRNERVWRLFDFNRAKDLGSAWKGYYQPGLEALYQHECENPALDEPVTNRFPRSLTANPFDSTFNAAGITDPARHCANQGVCRYRNPLPASESDPRLYTRGNAGDVASFLAWCLDDMPSHMESPSPSSTDDITDGIIDTAEWGKNVAIEIWQRNQFCVDGVVWDEWLDSLEPTYDDDGNLLDDGVFASQDCTYEDPHTGDAYTFPCADVTGEMMRVWRCLDTDASLVAGLLAGARPGILTTCPDTGKAIFDLDEIFNPIFEVDNDYGDGLAYPYTLEAMDFFVRFAFVFPIMRLGEQWLEEMSACFFERFDDPIETACPCTGDADCDEEYGERCDAGRCMQRRIYDEEGDCLLPDCEPVWIARECPMVFMNVEAGPCCGDGVVQSTDTYHEECDDGPQGSATCTPDCRLRDPDRTKGACCTAAGACFQEVSYEYCYEQLDGVAFYPGLLCAEVEVCEEVVVDPQLGACCVPDGCLADLTLVECRRFGTWFGGLSCAEADCPANPRGACCTPDGCFDGQRESRCEGRGDHYPGQTCAAIGPCPPPVATGACCVEEACIEGLTALECEHREGDWYQDQSCAEVNYCRAAPGPTGACCAGEVCFEEVTALICERLGGELHEGLTCAEVDHCRGVPDPTGACCVGESCLEGLTAPECARHGGDFYEDQSCAEVDHCRGVPDPTGACCVKESCLEGTTAEECERHDGDFHEGLTCDEVGHCRPAPDPTGACCVGESCLEGVTAEECARHDGDFHEDQSCAEVDHCRASGGGGGCAHAAAATSPGASPGATLLVALLFAAGVLSLRRRRGGRGLRSSEV